MILQSISRAATSLAGTIQSAPGPDTEQAKEATAGFDSAGLIPAGIIVASTLAIAFVVKYVVGRATQGLFRRRNKIISRLISRTVFAIVVAIGFVYALSSLGINVGLLVGALGIGGIALAFAFKDTLENFVSGLFLQIHQPFDYDDTVSLGDYEGSVDNINLRSVEMTLFSGEKVIIPAATVLQNPIENWTANPTRRVDIAIGVHYDTDVNEACAAISEALQHVPDTLAVPEPMTTFSGFGDSSINLVAHVWFASDGPYFDVQRDAADAIKRALAERDIEIPYPVVRLTGDRQLSLSS
ncbi:mechanosensitive ion channel family protein [Ilumatobacter nonamiensis]|uniref:mechanosensitive ion channel family protein n=1 Tax=Ilumatobacter nonamiensis TaxID=467093 RepID=UPI00034B7F7D|nr:mechanosensitive ion channel family protein [Ilumatobacter nonamiensis]